MRAFRGRGDNWDYEVCGGNEGEEKDQAKQDQRQRPVRTDSGKEEDEGNKSPKIK